MNVRRLYRSSEIKISTSWQRRLLLKRGSQIVTASVERAERCAIAILDETGVVVSWHDRLPDARPYDFGVVTGHMSQFYLPEDVALHVPSRHLSIAAELGVDTRRGWRRRPSGAVFWGVTIIQALQLPGGELLGYSHITRSLRGSVQSLFPVLRLMPPQMSHLAMA